MLWKENTEQWIRRIGFANYRLETKEIILGELKKKYKLINVTIMTVKMIIYTSRNSYTDLHLKQVKVVMRDLFLIEKYWAETNEKLPSFNNNNNNNN